MGKRTISEVKLSDLIIIRIKKCISRIKKCISRIKRCLEKTHH